MDSRNTQETTDPVRWLHEHGDYLYRFAMKQLHDSGLAEDAVQETLLAALQSYHTYQGESAERTWLTGILKHKIIDMIRKQSRETTPLIDALNAADDWDNTARFDQHGEWHVAQSHWGNPEVVLEQDRFWQAFDDCLQGMPPRLASVFSLRELSGLTTDELCDALNITNSNCWVLLYRARMTLKECLEANWLKHTDRGSG